jgi:hypothetical protein
LTIRKAKISFGNGLILFAGEMKNMAKSLRGQSAVEYLTTYGWAILLLVIVVGALLASGALNPSYFMSEECYLGPNLPCEFQLYQTPGGDQAMALNLGNGFPYKVGINKFEIQDQNGQKIGSVSSPFQMTSGEQKKLDVIKLDPDSAKPNTMNKYKVLIEYYSCAAEVNPNCDPQTGELLHTVNGRIIGRLIVQQ